MGPAQHAGNRMNSHLAPATHVAETGEVFFGFDELIYSRTDPRGVILAVNNVFQRMSNMPFADLIGAPHRIIRHPDMPKGFFHLFWQLLKQGLPAAGYVKNSRAGGGHYWVLAAATPTESGYCSVRLRPSTPLFQVIQKEYADLVDRERAENLSAEQSSQILLSQLQALGFADYDAFAAQVTADEIRARDNLLGLAPDAESETLVSLLHNLINTLDQQTALVRQFADLALLPVNMRLLAARLEPRAGPISQIAMNYKTASEDISQRLASLVSGEGNICGRMAQAVRLSLTLTGFSRMQNELVRRYETRNRSTAGDERRVEHIELCKLRDLNMQAARTALKQAEQLAASMNEASRDLRQMILGLDTIRILARVESRKSPEVSAALTATIDSIDHVQGKISESLRHLTGQTHAINAGLAILRRSGGPGEQTFTRPPATPT